MTIKKLEIKPGINREGSRYSTEGGWYECNKVRFRQGKAEKIGGWARTSANTFLGVCRSIWTWSMLNGTVLRGIGTHLKFYIDLGSSYVDITPVRLTATAGDITFSATDTDATLTVSHTAHGARAGDYVTYSGAATLGGLITASVLNHEYAIATYIDEDSYTVEATDTFGGSAVTANASDTGNGGAAVVGVYQVDVGPDVATPYTGWGSGPYGGGLYGTGDSSTENLRIWNQANYGEDLIVGVKRGALYYWDASDGTETPMTPLSDEVTASDVPTEHNLLLVSDISRFTFVFGCNIISTATYDPMLIRWSCQEDPAEWTPSALNQAGSLRLSRGSLIVAVKQSRQEILIWTDIALYSLQFLGAPEGWGAQLVGENISVASANSVSYSNGVSYWMGQDKFYVYTGQVNPLPCDLRRYVFTDINTSQYDQVFSGTNEAFHEVWWFYCSAGVTTIDSYVIFNYVEGLWYYGTLARTAWLDSAQNGLPVAATYSNNLVLHESGIDDNEGASAAAISAFILSSDFDIDDGDRFSLITRMIPDVNFEGSTAGDPSVDITLYPLNESGSGYHADTSVGGVNTLPVERSATSPVEEYTSRIDVRVRGRQIAMKVESSTVGVQWQLGSPRVDIRPSGRRG